MTANENGAMYGLDAACGQVGPHRPPNRTRLPNLLWVGHYTSPSHGIVGSALSGYFAANIISRKSKVAFSLSQSSESPTAQNANLQAAGGSAENTADRLSRR